MVAKPPTFSVSQPPDSSPLWRALTEQAPLPMATVEGVGHIVRQVNPAFCRLMERPAEQLVGQRFAELLPEKDVCVSLLDRVYRTGRSESFTEEGTTEPHQVLWSYTMWPLPADEHPAGIMLQVTETAKFHEQMIAMNEALLLGSVRQHELTEAAENLNALLQNEIAARLKLETQLRQAQKMEAVGQLTGGIAHDFNNILTVITGYSELLLDTLPPDDPKHESLKIIRDAGEQAAALTRQLLAFSRQTVLAPQVLDLNTIISDSEKLLRRLLGEDLVLTLVLESNIRRVKIDPNHLAQVLMNLAVNARDAMRPGGKLTIETRVIALDESPTQMGGEIKPGPYVVLLVTDTGCGMTPAVKSHIFEPFFTTKGLGKGTGLGLAVVFGIIKQSGGHIEVDSVPDLGTTFRIYLPAVEDEVHSPAKPLPGAHLRGTETILLAEDDANLRKLASLALQDYGYTLLQAADGREALRILETHPGPIDLLATDVVMPNLGGRELAAALRGRFPNMKVLFMSGYTDDVILRHGILQADFSFLQKPYTPNMLRLRVRQVLDEVERKK